MIVVRKLPWQSYSKLLMCTFLPYVIKFLELNDINKLDVALDTEAVCFDLYSRLQRVESSDSSVLSPPADAPDWALKPEY